MTRRNELIAAVVLKHIRDDLFKNESEGTLRICMVGLESTIVRAIASSAHNDMNEYAWMQIKINSEFDPNLELPAELRSNESITHWRHCPLPEGKRAVLFAATQDELQKNNKSVEKITKIEPDSLRTLHEIWVDQAGLTQLHLPESRQKHLYAALDAADQTNAARTIERFADFVLEISNAILSKGLPVQKAVDHALPALRLPCFSGEFDRIPEKKRTDVSEWKKKFVHILTKIRPYLYRENPKREPIEIEILDQNFEAIRERLSEDEKEIVSAFLESKDISADDWKPTQNDLVKLNWGSIYEVFEGKKIERLPLGERTIKFFEDEFDDSLDDDLRNLLTSAFPKPPTADLKNFFGDHQERIARDKKLYSSWEKYIYSSPEHFEDFFDGLIATLFRLYEQMGDEKTSSNRVIVRIPKSREKSFWQSKNTKIIRYFAARYRGIQGLFNEDITFEFGKLYEFYFPDLDKDTKENSSHAKDARRLKFEMELDPEGVKAKMRFFWHMPAEAVATKMVEDLFLIANENGVLLPVTEISRQSVSTKGQIQRIDLSDVNTLYDANKNNEGNMVAPNDPSGDCSEDIGIALEELSKFHSEVQIKNIEMAFSNFKESYQCAIQDWVGEDGRGIASSAFIDQVESFDKLLHALIENANNDRAHEHLWRLCLNIGLANVIGGTPAAIVLPWHPLRMAEFHVKAVQVAKLFNDILNANNEDVYRADLLFKSKREELLSDYYPEVCIRFDSDDRRSLLCLTDTKFGYSLAESPQLETSDKGYDSSFEINPDIAAQAFSEIGEQFLKLLPHEQNNFSIVLYNAESNSLPSALVKELSKKVQQDRDLQCDLLLTHSDPMRMRMVYEQQNVAVGDDTGSVMASEATRNFLSRLRVGFLDASDLPKGETTRTSDLVALQDVVARNSEIVWKPAPNPRHPMLIDHVPTAWSRRIPASAVQRSTAVYLTSPKQPEVGQTYLNAVYTLIHRSNVQSGDFLPAREVHSSDKNVREVFKEAHRIGEWVVNFDELVDRRFLANNDKNIRVIRHIHDRNVNRNITVSTTSKPRLLQALLKTRLDRIDPEIIKIHGDDSIEKLIHDATKLSGHVVMRAARHGHYANELLGVVLSMELLKSIIGNHSLPIGWYFLDDYASWFGQSEEQIADIMAIAPRIEEGKHVLQIAISEAKFVGSSGYTGHAKKSAKQLEETISRVRRALDPSHNRIDRESWLNRLGDFIINGMEPFDTTHSDEWSIHRWSDEIRQDNVPVILAGFSHVFVHDNTESVNSSEVEPLGNKMTHCYQQVFDKSHVAALLRSYFAENPVAVEETRQTKEIWAGALTSKSSSTVSGESSPEDKPNLPKEPAEESRSSTSESEEEEPYTVPSPEREQKPKHLKLLSEKFDQWLSKGRDQGDEETGQWLDNIVMALQKALRSYDMTAELLGKRLTPNAARIQFKGSDDLTITKVERRRQELLTSHAINVIDIIPAAKEVIIMVKRPSRAILHLKDLWRQRELPEEKPGTNASLLIGAREEDGKILYLNVEDEFGGLQQHGPHTLIAGETGSGKGVLVQCLLLDICATNSPKSARIRMIDPKAGIDFPWLRKMPHLDGELITTQDRSIEILEELVDEMERRNHLLAEQGVSKLSKYNQKVESSKRLPRIWLFHDELADWMLIDDYRDAVELNASRLGVKARAAGINLVLITQRPDKDAMPMQLRANLTNRLVLKVADKRNSLLVLDQPGAERLLGRGHLAAKLSGEEKVMLAQVPFADEDEITEASALIVDAWKAYPEI